MTTSTTSAAFISHVLDVAAKHGGDPDSLLKHVQLQGSHLRDPIKRIPMSKLRLLLAAAIEATGKAHFGLLVGSSVRPATYSGLGYVAMTSATLGEALSMVRRFGKIVFDSPSSQTQMAIADGLVTVADRRISEVEPYCVSQVDCVLSGWTAYGRWLIGHDLALQAVHMMHPAPSDPSVHEAFYQCPVTYEAGQNALIFAEALLQHPVNGADPRMQKSMILEAELELVRSYAPFSMKNKLRALLVERLPYGEAQLEVLAKQLAVSSRTLQRKLAAEGESFSAVLEAARVELAQRYLRETELSITDIAFMVGFAQAGAFSHAFRQACGISPADYRKNQ